MSIKLSIRRPYNPAIPRYIPNIYMYMHVPKVMYKTVQQQHSS